MMRRTVLALGILAVLAGVNPVWAQVLPVQAADPSKGNYHWYGVTVSALLFNVEIPGTLPLSKVTDFTGIPATGRYAGQNLTDNAAYHNGVVYGQDLAASNILRTTLWQQYVGMTKKEAGPLTGRAPSSLSFWEWVKIGEMSLKTYGKIRSIMSALKTGHIELNAWRLMPKVGAVDEDDPNAPALILSLVPSTDGPLGMIKEMTDWSDPRYRLSRKVNLSNLKGLVPSLAVKPSFYGAVAHMQSGDMAGLNVMTKLQRNFHELRTSLSMIQRQVAGGPANPYKRWNAVTRAQGLADLLVLQKDTWRDMGATISRGVALVDGKAAADWNTANNAVFSGLARMQQNTVRDQLARRGADDFAAAAIAGEMNNMTYALESEEYMEFIDNVELMIEEGASSKGVPGMGDEALADLRIEAVDAAVNRLVRDELRAIRQLYAIKARRELTDRLAPNVAMGLRALKEGADRLEFLERKLKRLQSSQAGATKVLSAQQAGKLLAEPFVL